MENISVTFYSIYSKRSTRNGENETAFVPSGLGPKPVFSFVPAYNGAVFLIGRRVFLLLEPSKIIILL